MYIYIQHITDIITYIYIHIILNFLALDFLIPKIKEQRFQNSLCRCLPQFSIYPAPIEFFFLKTLHFFSNFSPLYIALYYIKRSPPSAPTFLFSQGNVNDNCTPPKIPRYVQVIILVIFLVEKTVEVRMGSGIYILVGKKDRYSSQILRARSSLS